MDTTVLVETAAAAGVSGTAMVDAIARGQSYFAAKEPTAANREVWIAALKQDAPHLFTPAHARPETQAGALPPSWLSPAEKLTWARTHTPQPVAQRKPASALHAHE